MEHLDIKGSSTREILSAQGSSLLVIHADLDTLVIGKGNIKTPVRIPHCIAYASSTPQYAETEPQGQAPRSLDVLSEAAEATRLEKLLQRYAGKGAAAVTRVQQPNASRLAVDWVNVGEADPSQAGPRQIPRWVVGEEALSTHPEDNYQVVWPLKSLQTRPVHQVKDDLERIWRGALEAQLPRPAPRRQRPRHASTVPTPQKQQHQELPEQPKDSMEEQQQAQAAPGQQQQTEQTPLSPRPQQQQVQEEEPEEEQPQQPTVQQQLRALSAVLVVPDTFEADLVKLLVDVALTALGCRSISVHLEPAAAAFGQGVTSACLVSLGLSHSWVCCVEDGCVVPRSRVRLPYGVQQLSAGLLTLLRHYTGFPSQAQLDPQNRPADWWLLQRVVARHCFLPMEGEVSLVEQQVQDAGALEVLLQPSKAAPAEAYQLALGPLACLAPMALFYPRLLRELAVPLCSKEEESPRMPPSRWGVEANTAQELFYVQQLATNRPDVQQLPVPHYLSDLLPVPDRSTDDAEYAAARERLVGVDEAVVRSVLACAASVEHKLRLFQSIVVVGQGAALQGCGDMLERRVLHCLPPDDPDVEVVAVLEPREDPRHTAWRGGVILGCLDYQESWLTRSEWQNGGAHLGGRPHKMARSDNPGSKLFFYCKVQQGM